MSTHARTLTAVAAAALLGMAIAACGDDGDEASAESSAKAEYVKQANAVCMDTAKQAEKAFAEVVGDEELTPALAQEVLTELAEIITSSAERRAAIPAPPGDEDVVAEINAAGAQASEEFVEAASSKGTAAALMRGQTPDPAAEWDQLSADYGITECAGVD